ncbi:hypothetical protein GCM10022396_11950 [Flavivirga amylovorans]
MLGCTDPFQLETESFEDVLVIEATITDEFKRQEIKISRTSLLESDMQIFENNANVRIEASNGNVYRFSETQNGLYHSNVLFQAVEGISYKLLITTAIGREYVSDDEFLPPKAEIENLYGEVVNLNGEIGIQVLVDSNEDLGEANFFRYEYEETYKIIAPNFSFFDATLIGDVITLVPRDPSKQTCYSTNYSGDIILTSVSSLAENRISKFPIRLIPIKSSIIRERYSILVKQYVQSVNANTYYKILKDLNSDEEGVFIDNQPGFIKGNISSKQSINEKVIGFFDVSSVTSKRIYFNYLDFNLELPPYLFACDFLELDSAMTDPINERLILIGSFRDGYKYVSGNDGGVFTIVNQECGDCTTFSSNIKPTFWID